MEPRISRSTIVFYLLVVIGFVFAVLYFDELQEIVAYLKLLQGTWLLLAIAAQLLTYFCIARLLKSALKIHGLPNHVSVWELYKTAIIVLLFNQAIPTAGASGASYLFFRLTKKGLAPNRAASVIILQTLTYNIARLGLLILGLLLSFLFISRKLNPVFFVIGLLGIIIYTFIIAAIMVFGEKRALHRLYQGLLGWKLGGLLKRMGFGEEMFIQDDWHGSRWLFKHARWLLLKSCLWQMLGLMADVFTSYALYRGLEQTVPFISIMLCFFLTIAVSVISITPGSLAVFEGSLTFFYVILGIDLHTALTVTLLYRALSFWLPMPIGLFLYRRSTHPKHAAA